MNNNLLTYLAATYQHLPKPFAETLQLEKIEEIDTSQPNFDYFNFYLLAKAMLEDTDNNCFQIHIPNKYYKDENLAPIVQALSYLQYAKNQTAKEGHNEYADLEPNEDVIYNSHWGPLLLTHKNEDEYIFVKLITETSRRALPDGEIFVSRNKVHRYPRLPGMSDYKYNQRSISKIKKYTDFFKKKLQNFSSRFRFHSKCLVVGEKSLTSLLSKNAMLPFRFNMENTSKIPVEPLFEVANDFYQAKEILRKVKGIDTVLLIGAPKYNKRLAEFLQFKNEGLFNKLIIVGSQKATADLGFQTWHWTYDEMRILTGQSELADFPVITIEDTAIAQLKKDLDELASTWAEKGLKEQEVRHFFNGILNHCSRFITPKEVSDLMRFIQKRLYRTKNFEDLFPTPELKILIADCRLELETIFETFAREFTNGKYQYLLQLEDETKDYFIVTEKKQASHLNTEFTEFKKTNFKAVTPAQLERFVAKMQDSKEKDEREKVFIFPFIYFQYNNPAWYYRTFKAALENGEGQLLQYEDLDEKRLNALSLFFQKEQDTRMANEDRQWFMPVPFSQNGLAAPFDSEAFEQDTKTVIGEIDRRNGIGITKEEASTEKKDLVKNYFANYFGLFDDFEKAANAEESITGVNVKKATETTAAESVYMTTSNQKFKILFEDSEKIIAEYQPIAKEKGRGRFTNVMASDLQAGDSIIAEFKVNFARHFDALKVVPPLKPQMREISWASREWRTWLKTSLRFYVYKLKSEDMAKRELYRKLDPKSSFTTMEKWLTSKDRYLFPKNDEDLEKILELSFRQTPKDRREEKREQILRILNAREVPDSFVDVMVQLEEELIEYMLNKKTGRFLSKMTSSALQALIKSRVVKEVKEVEELDF